MIFTACLSNLVIRIRDHYWGCNILFVEQQTLECLVLKAKAYKRSHILHRVRPQPGISQRPFMFTSVIHSNTKSLISVQEKTRNLLLRNVVSKMQCYLKETATGGKSQHVLSCPLQTLFQGNTDFQVFHTYTKMMSSNHSLPAATSGKGQFVSGIHVLILLGIVLSSGVVGLMG